MDHHILHCRFCGLWHSYCIAARVKTLGDLKTECVDTFALVVVMTVSDVAVDLVILIVPVPLVRGFLHIWSRYAY